MFSMLCTLRSFLVPLVRSISLPFIGRLPRGFPESFLAVIPIIVEEKPTVIIRSSSDRSSR